jgi:hypothetical protein
MSLPLLNFVRARRICAERGTQNADQSQHFPHALFLFSAGGIAGVGWCDAEAEANDVITADMSSAGSCMVAWPYFG